MKERDRVARARSSRSTTPARLLVDGESYMAPWRTLITAVHPHPSVKINHGATFLVTDQQGAIPLGSAGEYGLYSADTRFISRHVSTRPLAHDHGQHRGTGRRHA